MEVYNISENAINYVKNDKKPALIEFETFRWLEHCGPNWDDNLGYRKKGELQKWMEACPIKNFEKKLIGNELDKNKIKKLKEKISKEIERAFDYAIKSPFPKINLLLISGNT